MTDQRSNAIELAKIVMGERHPQHEEMLARALLAEVEARENAELIASAIEEGSAEWEERCKTAETKVKELQATNTKIRRALEIASNQLEGVSIAISTHGQNINTTFFVDEYKHYSVAARQAMDDKNL